MKLTEKDIANQLDLDDLDNTELDQAEVKELEAFEPNRIARMRHNVEGKQADKRTYGK